MELLKKYTGTFLVLFFMFLSLAAKVQGQELVVHDLKKPLEVKSFDKRNFSLGKTAMYFESADNSGRGRLTVSLSTLAQDNVKLSWQNTTANKSKSKWYARLQYRLDINDEWQDVTDGKGNKIEFVSTFKRYARELSATLPQECNNRQFVQVSWLVDSYSEAKNAKNPDILFRKIEIRSSYDKYLGVKAEIKVMMASDATADSLDSRISTPKELSYGNISLPYVYPASKRLMVRGSSIRDSIAVRIKGEDAQYFNVSQSSVSEKQSLGKVVTVSYAPKKEGHHSAQLILSSFKADDVVIDLSGSCARQKEFEKNLLPDAYLASTSVNYHIPVFSSSAYQFRLEQKKDSVQTIKAKYNFYENNRLVLVMHDTITKEKYCAPITTPKAASSMDIILEADNDIALEKFYFGTPDVITMVKSGNWFDVKNWEPGRIPVTEDYVKIDDGVTALVTEDAGCQMLILGDSANVDVSDGKMFYVSNDIYYGKKSFITIHQYLIPSRWNYISSPVNQARAAVFSMKNASSSNESWLMEYTTGIKSRHDDYWSEYITDPSYTLSPAKGYAVYTHQPMDVKYEGVLCNSTITVPLVSGPSDRWNLIGNPYTAPLSTKKLYEDIDGRIQGDAIMLYDRENEVYNPLVIDPREEIVIPSLESFFVEAPQRSADITFRRSQQYIPHSGDYSWDNQQLVKLSVSTGNKWQYALLGMNDNAEYSFDEYDAHKMFGSNEKMPEVYLSDGEDEMSVCVFPDYPAIYDIGLYAGEKTDAELNLNNLSVLPDYVTILLEDKTDGQFIDFCNEGNVKVSLEGGDTEKYRIHILRSQKLKILSADKESGICLWSDNGRMLLHSNSFVKLQAYRLTALKTKNSADNGKMIEESVFTDGQMVVKTLDKGSYTVNLKIDGVWSEDIPLTVK